MIILAAVWAQRGREPGWAQEDWLGNCNTQDKTWAPWARAGGAEVVPCCRVPACRGGRPARTCRWKGRAPCQGTIKGDFEMLHLRRLEFMDIICHYQNLKYVYSYRWLWDFFILRSSKNIFEPSPDVHRLQKKLSAGSWGLLEITVSSHALSFYSPS